MKQATSYALTMYWSASNFLVKGYSP